MKGLKKSNFALVITALLLFAFVGISNAPSQKRVETQKLTYGENVYANNKNAVVTIFNFDASGKQQGLGSGFFISSTGEAVTNYHVIEGASSLLVQLLNKAIFPVEGWLAADSDKDIAVLKVDGKELTTVRLGSLQSVKVGQLVFALGSPLGMPQTFTNGMVSSLRDGSEVDKPELPKVIQHTAPISPGNSGGPLFDEQGSVVGINTFQAAQGQNLNFAIPIDYVKPLLGKKDVKPLPVGPPKSINVKDGAEMVYIPEGEFIMGTSDEQIDALLQQFPDWKRSWFDDEKPQRCVYLDGYWIYEYEVTVAQYRKFCQETRCQMPPEPSWSWQDNHPIVNVTWNDAVDYCNWAGMQLPTEAQWEKAARGTTDKRIWPWGNKWDSNKCNSDSSGRGGTTPVGSFPSGASPYGLMDMAGNVWEWCADWYDENYYRNSPTRNPQGPASGIDYVLRAGSWLSFPFNVRAANRLNLDPVDKYHYIGFRCSSPRFPS